MTLKIERPWPQQGQSYRPINDQWLGRGLRAVFQFSRHHVVDPLTGLALPMGTGQSLVPGPAGYYRRFTGTGVDTGLASIGGVTLNTADGLPFSVFVKYSKVTADTDGVLVARAGSVGNGQILNITSSIGGVNGPEIRVRGADNNLTWGFRGGAHSITVAYDGTTAVAYGDLDRQATLTIGTGNTAANITIGSRTNTTGFPLTGNIESVLLFARAISRDEHAQLHANTNVIYVPRKIWVPVSAGGGLPTLSNATFVPGSLTSVGFRPRVTAS